MVDCLQTYYKGRLCKMFVVNAGVVVYVIWKIAESLMDRNTRAKIFLSSEQKPPELLKYIHPNQLIDSYGGRWEEPKSYWPPTFPTGPFREEFETKHATMEEFKTELLEKPQLMPSPELSGFVRSHRSAKCKKGTFERKTFILETRTERRDSFNGIIRDSEPAKVEAAPVPALPFMFTTSAPASVVILDNSPESAPKIEPEQVHIPQRISAVYLPKSDLEVANVPDHNRTHSGEVKPELNLEQAEAGQREEVKEFSARKAELMTPRAARVEGMMQEVDNMTPMNGGVDADKYQESPRKHAVGGDKASCGCVVV